MSNKNWTAREVADVILANLYNEVDGFDNLWDILTDDQREQAALLTEAVVAGTAPHLA